MALLRTPFKLSIASIASLAVQHKSSIIRIHLLLATFFAVCTSISVHAQDYPSRPIRIINGFPPGGNVDLVGRLIAQKLGESLKQPVIVESKPGAGTMIANDFVAKAPADGYTILLVSGAFPTVAATQRKLPYDPVRDFAWLTTIFTYPLVAIVRPDSPLRSIDDLIATAKANPGKLTFPSPGVRSLIHLAGELFCATAGVEMLHIPYKSSAETVTEVMTGRIDVLFETLTLASTHLQAGKVRALAITSAQRVPHMPDLPAVAERLPGFETTSFIGMAAPRGTPGPIVQRLTEEFHKMLALPDIRQRFSDLGGTPRPSTPDETAAFIEKEIVKWRRVVEARKIAID
ncbi:MAG: tripartite tricarboxylate transporter substrate binding protein [Betaproteobacteria bacterium]|nr:tripartite tricarboxylate transporter substrate binding protein [Betaproteobacteria bacterium]